MKKRKKRNTSKINALSDEKKRVFVKEVEFRDGRGYIDAATLEKLRQDTEFLDVIRVMRLANVLSFSAVSILNSNQDGAPEGRRGAQRTSFNAGGYLHEGIKLIDKLAETHEGTAPFQAFRSIRQSLSPLQAKMLEWLRNNAAFHLDHKDYSTRQAISELRLAEVEIFHKGEGQTPLDIYFPIPDIADMNYVIDRIKEWEIKHLEEVRVAELRADEIAWENRITSEISILTGQLTRDMLDACVEFVSQNLRRKGLLRPT